MMTMTFAHGARCKAQAIGLIGALAGSDAFGQAVKYEFFVLPPQAAFAESGGLGINNEKTVVGWSGPGGPGGVRRATMWRRCPSLGALPYSSPVDLAILAGIATDSSRSSEAREVNEAGVAVGFVDYVTSSAFTRGFVWDVPNASYAAIGTFSGGATDKSEAWGINDETEPVIAGWAQDSFTCSGLSAHGPVTAFRVVWSNGLGSLVALSPGATEEVCDAHDLRTTGDAEAVGFRTSCGELQECSPSFDALEWTGTSPTSLGESGNTNGSTAWATNEAGMTVGSIDAQDADCVTHAVIWLTPSTPIDLSETSGYNAARRTEARGIAEPLEDGTVLVVGNDLAEPRALLWVGTPSDESYSWTYQYLDDLVSPISTWTFTETYDLTDDGWIVARGAFPNMDPQAIVFRPAIGGLLCPGDVDRSGAVDATDLGILLGAWGVPSTCYYLTDVDIDGDVDAADLGLLLGGWGAGCEYCPGGDAATSTMSAEGTGTAGGASSALSVALAALGFADVDAFVAWANGASDEELSNVACALSLIINGQEGG